MTIDLSYPVRKDSIFPWYLPSINNGFAKPLNDPAFKQRPKALSATIPDPGRLNFLLKDSFYYYPRCLYSAGLANWDLTVSKRDDASIRSRDTRNTTIMADSAGYQIAEGTDSFDWNNPDKTREKILRWQESIANVGMYIDVPSRTAFADYKGNVFYKNPQKVIDTI